MQTSARNVLACTIQDIRGGAINDEITLQLPGGESLVAVVTHTSTEAMGLAPGAPVHALVKAPWVVLVTDAEDMVFSARNQLPGQVVKVVDGAVNSEVVLRLKGGTELAAIVTRESAASLGLKPGAAAAALIKASHVLLAAPRKG